MNKKYNKKTFTNLQKSKRNYLLMINPIILWTKNSKNRQQYIKKEIIKLLEKILRNNGMYRVLKSTGFSYCGNLYHKKVKNIGKRQQKINQLMFWSFQQKKKKKLLVLPMVWNFFIKCDNYLYLLFLYDTFSILLTNTDIYIYYTYQRFVIKPKRSGYDFTLLLVSFSSSHFFWFSLT